jgi:hypothetical protein
MDVRFANLNVRFTHFRLLEQDLVGVYCIRKGNILWNVRVWGGIKETLKQLPECHTTQ